MSHVYLHKFPDTERDLAQRCVDYLNLLAEDRKNQRPAVFYLLGHPTRGWYVSVKNRSLFPDWACVALNQFLYARGPSNPPPRLP